MDIYICRYVEGGLSHRGHNGLKSIIASLKSNDFKRLRIGIGRPKSRDRESVSQYVLSNFSKSETRVLEDKGFPMMFDEIQNKFLI